MTRTLKHQPMMIALICASFFQFLAIIADQYVLNLDYKIEKLKHKITITENFQYDLQNTLKVLRYAHRFSEDMSMYAFFNRAKNNNLTSEESSSNTNKSLYFTISEIEQIYEIYSIENISSSKDKQELLSVAKPLLDKIKNTETVQSADKKTHKNTENKRHLFILLAVIAQILGLFSLLGFFLFATKDEETT